VDCTFLDAYHSLVNVAFSDLPKMWLNISIYSWEHVQYFYLLFMKVKWYDFSFSIDLRVHVVQHAMRTSQVIPPSLRGTVLTTLFNACTKHLSFFSFICSHESYNTLVLQITNSICDIVSPTSFVKDLDFYRKYD
jgi:hypothetical protein